MDLDDSNSSGEETHSSRLSDVLSRPTDDHSDSGHSSKTTTRHHIVLLLKRAFWVRKAAWPTTLCQLALPALLVMVVGLIAMGERTGPFTPTTCTENTYPPCGSISNTSYTTFGNGGPGGSMYDLPAENFVQFLVGGSAAAGSLPVFSQNGTGILGCIDRYTGHWTLSTTDYPPPAGMNGSTLNGYLPFVMGNEFLSAEAIDEKYVELEKQLLELKGKLGKNAFALYGSTEYAEMAATVLPSAALIFDEVSPGVSIDYTVQFYPGFNQGNTFYLTVAFGTNSFSTSWLNPYLPTLMNVIHTAAWRNASGDMSRTISGQLGQFPSYNGAGSSFQPPVSSTLVLSHFLYPLAFALLLPNLVFLVVLEKEEKQRELMLMMGLKDAAYWIGTFLADFLMWIVVAGLCVIVGASFQVTPFDRADSAFVAILFLVLWAPQMSLIADLWSIFVGKNRAIVTLLLYIVVLGFASTMGTLNLFSMIQFMEVPWGWLYLIPSTAFFHGFGLTINHQAGDAMVWPLIAMLLQICVLSLMFSYLHLVVPQSIGVARHPLFFIEYFRKKRVHQVDERSPLVGVNSADDRTRHLDDIDPAVQVERDRVHSGAASRDAVVFDGIRKQYPGSRVRAVDGITLGMVRGQCFGLLGPNGSGKTTLIGMLTGLFNSSSGHARIMGADVSGESVAARRVIGICPQFDVQWPALTTRQHIEFYSALRGLGTPEHVVEIARAVGLEDALDKKSKELSGGMRRRLSVAMAIAGEPKVLILDEPTTGLDVGSRRQMWNFLDTYRRAKSATILLTTHSMEEADTLCSRIGIIALGRLRALGSPADLKQKFGVGCTLTVSFEKLREAEGDADIQKVLQALVPSWEIQSKVQQTWTYRVSGDLEISKLLPLMSSFGLKGSSSSDLTDVASDRNDATGNSNSTNPAVLDWSISHSTLEDVFVAVCDQFRTTDRKDRLVSTPHTASTTPAVSTLPAQWAGLMKKTALQTLKTKSFCLALVPLFGCLVLFLTLLITRLAAVQNQLLHPEAGFFDLPRCSTLDGAFPENCVTLSWAPSSSAAARAAASAVASRYDIPSSELREYSSGDQLVLARLAEPDKFLFGFVLDTDAPSTEPSYQLFYNGNVSSAWGTNVSRAAKFGSVESVLGGLASSSGWASPMLLPLQLVIDSSLTGIDFSLQLKSIPIVLDASQQPSVFILPIVGSLVWTLAPALIGFYFMFQISKEKDLRLREGLEIVGVQSSTYWCSTMVTASLFIVVSVLVLVASGAAFGFSLFSSGKVDLSVTICNFLLLSLAVLASFFCLGATCKARSGANMCAALFILANTTLAILFCSPTMITLFLSEDIDLAAITTLRTILMIFFPALPFSKVYSASMTASGVEDYFMAGLGAPPQPADDYFSWVNLTQPKNSTGPLGTKTVISGWDAMGVMIGQICMFLVISWYADNVLYHRRPIYFPFLIPREFLKARRHRLNRHHLTAAELETDIPVSLRHPLSGDKVVASETLRAEQQYDAAGRGSALINVVHMSKAYGSVWLPTSLLRTPPALIDLSLPIDGHQVYCILGKNGAGKSTLLHILNGVLAPTTGTAEIHGFDVRYDLGSIRPLIGLCPQHDILWPELSAREHLEFFAAVKGVPRASIPAVVDHLLESTELEDVANNPCQSYSGGMKRRLSVAIASVGAPAIVFLDEPTTGCDPSVKRSLWNLVDELKRTSTIILTTHALDEADTLSDNVTIMGGGRALCTGTPLRLKHTYGSGMQLHIGCRPIVPAGVTLETESKEAVGDQLAAEATVKQFVQQACPNAELVSCDAGNMQFGVRGGADQNFIRLCSLLEDLKNRPREVVEWSVSEGSLEEVFMRLGLVEASSPHVV